MVVTESPVEQLLYDALIKVLPAIVEAGFRLETQYEASPYRLDFAFVASDRKMCVEVDGHDNHDRTRAQAKHDRRRDRVLMFDGWRVIRFTGSEVYNTAASCVNEILLHLKQLKPPTKGEEKLSLSIAKAIRRLTQETEETVRAAREAIDVKLRESRELLDEADALFKVRGY